MASFFQPGESSVHYANIRDVPDCEKDRAFVERLWPTFAPFADPGFLGKAKLAFMQQFWEMYLWSTLSSWRLNPQSNRGNGLDFWVELEGKTVWFEANVPEAGTGVNGLKEPPLSQLTQIPYDKVIFRLTNAFSNKVKQYRHWRDANKVKREDPFIIALNVRMLPHTRFDSSPPLLARAFLGAGELLVPVKTDKDDKRRRLITRKNEVFKLNRSPVETATLLSDAYRDVSGVLASRADTAAHSKPFGYDFLLLCNPLAINPVPDRIARRCTRLILRDDKLYRIGPEATV